MLPKNKRINLRTEYKSVVSGALRKEGRFLSLFLKTGEGDFPRVGISLSGKTLKRSHERNRARRLVSQAFQDIYSTLPSRVNIIALPKKNILEVKSADVLLELKELLKKVSF